MPLTVAEDSMLLLNVFTFGKHKPMLLPEEPHIVSAYGP